MDVAGDENEYNGQKCDDHYDRHAILPPSRPGVMLHDASCLDRNDLHLLELPSGTAINVNNGRMRPGFMFACWRG